MHVAARLLYPQFFQGCLISLSSGRKLMCLLELYECGTRVFPHFSVNFEFVALLVQCGLDRFDLMVRRGFRCETIHGRNQQKK